MSAGFGSRALGRLAVALAVLCSVVGGVSGCSIIGGTAVSQEEATRTNLANQRKVAIEFRRDYASPDLTAIRFTQDGDVPALGAGWSVNAVLTIGGQGYKQILWSGAWGGDRLPEPLPGADPGPVVVTYSDDTMEVLK